MCQVEPGRRAKEIKSKLEGAAVPVPHVGRRERQAAEANIERAIEIAATAERPEDIVVGPPPFPLDQPIGVYHG
jgi:uncharacterized protein YfaP (DUF2135 family)